MVNNNSELTFSELSAFSLDSPPRFLIEIFSNKNMFSSRCWVAFFITIVITVDKYLNN